MPKSWREDVIAGVDGVLHVADEMRETDLIVLNGGRDTISAFRIRQDGGLTPIATLSGLPASADGLAIR